MLPFNVQTSYPDLQNLSNRCFALHAIHKEQQEGKKALINGFRFSLNSKLGGVKDVASVHISHEKRLNQTESAVFKHGMLYFKSTLKRCGGELNARCNSAASLKYHAPYT